MSLLLLRIFKVSQQQKKTSFTHHTPIHTQKGFHPGRLEKTAPALSCAKASGLNRFALSEMDGGMVGMTVSSLCGALNT